MPRYGVIIQAEGRFAVVRTPRRGICEGCSNRGSCSFDSALGKDIPEEVRVLNPIRAGVGEFVEFDLPSRGELKLSLLIWGLPLIFMIAGAALGSRFSRALPLSADLAALFGAFGGLVISIIPLVIYDRLARRTDKLTPVILRRATPDSCPGH